MFFISEGWKPSGSRFFKTDCTYAFPVTLHRSLLLTFAGSKLVFPCKLSARTFIGSLNSLHIIKTCQKPGVFKKVELVFDRRRKTRYSAHGQQSLTVCIANICPSFRGGRFQTYKESLYMGSRENNFSMYNTTSLLKKKKKINFRSYKDPSSPFESTGMGKPHFACGVTYYFYEIPPTQSNMRQASNSCK